jgi:hypothetical protein
MRFTIALLLALRTVCQEVVPENLDFFEQSPGDFDTSIAIETVFVKEWTAEKV